MSLTRSAVTTKTEPSEHIPVLAANATDEQGSVRLTKKAIEMARAALVKRGTPDAALRLGVRGGGCSGVSYAIEFADKVRERDHKFEFDGLRVVVDPKSLVYLRGAVLDYEIKLMQHGFRFQNPNEKIGCGCGDSFSI
jgi:iron-sulfur cluster assembly protein